MKSRVTMRRATLGAILLGSAFAMSATPDSTSVAVNYGDLDMSRPESAQRLYSRIARAAERVCYKPSRGDLARIPAYRECYRGAIDGAVKKVDAQTLTALHRTKTQKSSVS